MILFYTTLLDTEPEKSKMEQLYKTFHKMMLWAAHDILHEQMAAEDAVHTSFLKVVRHLDKVDETDYPRAKRFMLTIVKNTSLDMLRKRRREARVPLDEMEDWSMPLCQRADYYELPEENRDILAIKSMPDLYRDIFLLKYSSGYENGDISAMLGISEDSVRQRISRGKKKLEKILNKEGIL